MNYDKICNINDVLAPLYVNFWESLLAICI